MVFLAISIPLFERHTVLAVYHEVAKPAGRGILGREFKGRMVMGG